MASGVLDDTAALARFDRGGMLGAIERLPEQLGDGWRRTRDLRLPEQHREVRSVVVLGMGGSGVGGDLVRGIFADVLRLPIVSVRDYDLPAFAGPDALVVAASHSGSTEETVSALAAALRRRCQVAVITTGGPLKEVATRAELPLLTFPPGGQPRAAVGYSVVLLAGLLERAGVLELDEAAVRAAMDAAATMVAACRPEVPTERNPAKALAWTLVDRLAVVEASGSLVPVARRWKTQLNENGKTMALTEELPEATHNTIVGYAQPETIKDHVFVVFLASSSDHPRNSLRASLSAELLAASQIGHQVVSLNGDGRLAQAFSGIVLGDFVSVYLGILYGFDPTPVDAIGLMKSRLSEVDEEAED